MIGSSAATTDSRRRIAVRRDDLETAATFLRNDAAHRRSRGCTRLHNHPHATYPRRAVVVLTDLFVSCPNTLAVLKLTSVRVTALVLSFSDQTVPDAPLPKVFSQYSHITVTSHLQTSSKGR